MASGFRRNVGDRIPVRWLMDPDLVTRVVQTMMLTWHLVRVVHLVESEGDRVGGETTQSVSRSRAVTLVPAGVSTDSGAGAGAGRVRGEPDGVWVGRW